MSTASPVEGVILDCWQNASNMFYAVQQPGIQSDDNLRGIYHSQPDGTFEIRSIRPVPYPIPSDGPAGDLLKKNGRNWWRPGHLHIWARHPGYKDLITHVFDVESDFLDGDAVFGVQRSLIREFKPDDDRRAGDDVRHRPRPRLTVELASSLRSTGHGGRSSRCRGRSRR